MGLQDSLVMSAVPAQDVIKSRSNSAMSATSSRGQAAALEEDLQALNIKASNNSEIETNNSVADNNDLDFDYDINAACGVYADSADDWDWQTDESRLSRALHMWMPNYVITPLPRQGHTSRQPVFSARLGRETTIHRVPSCESIDTQLSLFSCSSNGSKKTREKKRRRLRRRKTVSAERRENNKPQSAGQGSRWVQLAKRRKGELDRFMMAQSHALTQAVNLTDESEAFQLCDPDEQRALFLCGQRNKLAFAATLKKSNSMTNIKEPEARGRSRQRVASAGAKTFYGKPIDFQELRRQMMSQKLAALNALHRRSLSGRGRSLHRSLSRHSLTSVGSSEVFLSATAPHSPPLPERKENRVSMWKGDSQILAIDLKRELTTKVKHRIAVTTTAIERVTGMGDDNEQRPYTCHLEEFPAYIDDDFAKHPKIPQKIRISPHLSDVIKSDIRVRMGRPRYHEIRVRDVEIWNRGQTLDRAHRNLKVFNWLHSLKEDEFDVASLQQNINDVPPDLDDVTFGEMVLIRAVDEPDVKPLYEQKKTYVR